MCCCFLLGVSIHPPNNNEINQKIIRYFTTNYYLIGSHLENSSHIGNWSHIQKCSVGGQNLHLYQIFHACQSAPSLQSARLSFLPEQNAKYYNNLITIDLNHFNRECVFFPLFFLLFFSTDIDYSHKLISNWVYMLVQDVSIDTLGKAISYHLGHLLIT